MAKKTKTIMEFYKELFIKTPSKKTRKSKKEKEEVEVLSLDELNK